MLLCASCGVQLEVELFFGVGHLKEALSDPLTHVLTAAREDRLHEMEGLLL